ncbi:MAG: hypothetical protein MJ211_15245 [Bacteroidales bacterium]|nr:hypothetical protein [Bacteroidales bacterium]
MIKVVITYFILLSAMVSSAQIINIDSLYYTQEDTVITKQYNQKNRYCIKKLWMSFNNGQNKMLDKEVFDKWPPQGLDKRYSPVIMKHIFNEFDSLVYRVEYYKESLSMKIIRLDGSSLNDSPYNWQSPEHQVWIKENYIWANDKINEYTENYLQLKDIDIHIENNVFTFRCYKYTSDIVVFSYDLNAKEWTIVEDRKLTDEEIAECGLYESEKRH